MKTLQLVGSVVIAIAMIACGPQGSGNSVQKTKLDPKLEDVLRGAAKIDLYGRWDRKLETLGRGGPYQVGYTVEWAPADSVIEVDQNGTVVTGTLRPLENATNTLTLAANNAVLTPASPAKLVSDPNGKITVTIRTQGVPGANVLSNEVTYAAATFTDTDEFESSAQSETAWER